jgi:hypothetical protein
MTQIHINIQRAPVREPQDKEPSSRILQKISAPDPENRIRWYEEKR